MRLLKRFYVIIGCFGENAIELNPAWRKLHVLKLIARKARNRARGYYYRGTSDLAPPAFALWILQRILIFTDID